jgi:hypothetical protein
MGCHTNLMARMIASQSCQQISGTQPNDCITTLPKGGSQTALNREHDYHDSLTLYIGCTLYPRVMSSSPFDD